MSDQKISGDQQKFQDALAKAAAHSLDQSVDSMDDLTNYRLKQIRQKALTVSPEKRFSFEMNKHWAVAACLVVAVSVPSIWLIHSGSKLDAEENAFLSQELSQEMSLDEQDFDDMDMLIAMGESDA